MQVENIHDSQVEIHSQELVKGLVFTVLFGLYLGRTTMQGDGKDYQPPLLDRNFPTSSHDPDRKWPLRRCNAVLIWRSFAKIDLSIFHPTDNIIRVYQNLN
jgi:hypothetical protein